MKLKRIMILVLTAIMTTAIFSGCNKVDKQTEIALSSDEIIEGKIHKDITNDVKEIADEIIGQDSERVGFIFYDLINDRSVLINEDKYFTAASVYKVGMNVIAYEMVNSGELSLDDTILYNSSYYEGGAGNLQNEDKSQPISIQKLLDYSIMYSDNIATNMIGRNIGGHASVRQKLYDMFKIENTENIKANLITPRLELEILKKIYNSKDDENYAHLIEMMENTIYHDRIDKYIPYDECAHKIGNYKESINDAGIILNETPYIIIMFTDNIENAEEKISFLSKKIYDLQKENI